MTKGRRKSVFRLAGAVLILLVVAVCMDLAGGMAGCGTGPGTTVSGGNPAAPPAPPAEVPAALRFPSDLSIDATTIGSPSSASNLAALVGSGGQFSDEISFAADFAPFVELFANSLLQPLPQIDIPVSTDTTTFAVTGLFSNPNKPEDPPLEYDIKIDFADFDFDGDGLTEGCSGNTAGLPICFRVWFSGEQQMAGLFTRFPTALNQGAGQFRAIVHVPAEKTTGGSPAQDGYVGVLYDDSVPPAKSTEIFLREVLAGDAVNQKNPDAPDFHLKTTQEGPDETARKSLLVSAAGYSPAAFREVTGVPNDLQYVGQWREDNDFWSGSASTHNIDLQNFSDVCALISTGNPSNLLNCVDLNIDVADIPFLDFLTTDDVALPADFPKSPTFE
jgi:hypothetical protein